MPKMKNPFSERTIFHAPCLVMKEIGARSYGYLTIKGSVKNKGLIKVIQCFIKLNLYDNNNNVVCTDKICVIGDIAPGKARTFHSMTAWINSAETYNLSIDEVRVKK